MFWGAGVSTRGLHGRVVELDKKEEVVRFGAYNIQNSCNGILKSALCGIDQVKIDLGLLQDTNITDRVYARVYMVFCVVVLDSPSFHRRGVVLFYKESLRFTVEARQHHGPNAISFQLVTGGQCWYMMGC